MLFKNKKKKLLICFEPVAAVSVITMGKRMCAFMATFLEDSLSV